MLGVLIREPKPLRLADVGSHPESYGFPLAHPPMHSFLGVPIVVREESWGNLYLTEKDGGAFTEEDEEAVMVLADWAAIAIANSRLHRDMRQRRDDLERVNRGLETTTEVARALGGGTDVERVLELVVKRSRALINARAATLALVDGDELVVAAVAGHGVEGLVGRRFVVEGTLSSEVLSGMRQERLGKVPATSFASRELGATTAVITPMMFHNRAIGVLSVIDRQDGNGEFTDEDQRLLQAFAASAATAVATAQTASSEALRRSIRASEQERQRWARELHDDTLQEMGGLKMLLAGARRSGDREQLRAAVDDSVDKIGRAIGSLRAMITELRPASLDELGTQPALEALAERVRSRSELDVELEVRLAYEEGRVAERHVPDLEVAIYRVVQEGLANIVRHAGARRAEVRVVEGGEPARVRIEIRDDGCGFDIAAEADGTGLTGMRERLALVHGVLDIDARPGHGTLISASIPSRTLPATQSPAPAIAG